MYNYTIIIPLSVKYAMYVCISNCTICTLMAQYTHMYIIIPSIMWGFFLTYIYNMVYVTYKPIMLVFYVFRHVCVCVCIVVFF